MNWQDSPTEQNGPVRLNQIADDLVMRPLQRSVDPTCR